MLSGGGGGGVGGGGVKSPLPGIGAPMRISDLEAEALASATSPPSAMPLEPEDVMAGALSADFGALGLGFLGISTDDDDFSLPPRSASVGRSRSGDDREKPPAAAAGEEATAGDKPKDKEAARLAKRERKKKEKEEEKMKKEEDEREAIVASKPSVTAYTSAALLSLRAGCTSSPSELDMDMFEQADKALVKQEKKTVAAKDTGNPVSETPSDAEKRDAEKRDVGFGSEPDARDASSVNRPSRSPSEDRLDEPSIGGALGLGFLGISSASLAGMDADEAAGREKQAEKMANGIETPAAAPVMGVSELAKALLAELRGLEDRVEVAGDESGPAVLRKLGSALEAIRDEPFKSI
jgi:hypothetical protein